MWLVTSWEHIVLIIVIHKTFFETNTIFSCFINKETKAQRTQVKTKVTKLASDKNF